MNNRQANNGRRRGRGGQRSQGGNPNQNGGNRIDNRARGNAAQLLEKYKNLARDAQMQGDRVNTEYYLQFADHYFRVLSENRSRFEEQNRHQRGDQAQDSDEDFEFEGEGESDDLDMREAPRQQQQRNGYANGHANGERYRDNREARDNREPRDNRDNRDRDHRDRDGAEDAGEQQEARSYEPREEREGGRRNTRGRNNNFRERREAAPEVPVEAPVAKHDDAIDVAVLPPAFGLEGEPIEEVKPRRRGRPRKSDSEAPSA
jgi:hypothetical protein